MLNAVSGVFGGGRVLSRKLATSRANTLKAEGAVFAAHVRGGELESVAVMGGEGRTQGAPLSLLLPARDWDPPPTSQEHSDDEGYY